MIRNQRRAQIRDSFCDEMLHFITASYFVIGRVYIELLEIWSYPTESDMPRSGRYETYFLLK
jgi:hypothetical protein